jgi:hypothetical protein
MGPRLVLWLVSTRHLISLCSKGLYVKESTFSKLLNECQKSLDALVAESQQTLNLAQLVQKFPQDPDRKAALQLQYLRENRVRLGYEARRDELLRLVTGRSETNSAA